MPSMSSLVTSLINLLPAMGDILILFLFTVLMFATVAMQLFGGSLSQRCVRLDTINEEDFSQEVYLLNDKNNPGTCGDESEFFCPEDYECLSRQNPQYGLFNADNLAYACLLVFSVITLEGWADQMYIVREAKSRGVIFDLYFVMVVLTGAFFILNLMTAVQFKFFDEEMKEKKQKKVGFRKVLKDVPWHKKTACYKRCKLNHQNKMRNRSESSCGRC